MVSVNYALLGANGDRITFDNSNYILNADFTGFNVAPAQVRIEQSARDGGVFRHAKKSIRELDLVVTTLGADRADVQTKLRRLSRILQPTLGPTILEAIYSDGVTLTMQVYYVGGAEGQWGSSAGQIWNRWVLSFQAPVPYWEEATEISYTFGESPTGRGLLPQLTKLKLASDNVLGEVIVNNLGDVPSYPKWVILGPIENVVISNGTQTITIPGAIGADEQITIETLTGKVYDDDEVNRYDILGPAPKMFPLPPGQTELTVTGDETSEATRVGFFYKARYEVVH